jgi:hypothetical protein
MAVSDFNILVNAVRSGKVYLPLMQMMTGSQQPLDSCAILKKVLKWR